MPLALAVDIYNSKSESTKPFRDELQKTANAFDTRSLAQKLEEYTGEVRTLEINPPVDLNFLDRESVFALRKEYVSRSLFAKEDYKPEDSPVLSGIQSEKPWVGLFSEGKYLSKKFKINQGVSEESRFLNNPNVLVGLAISTVQTCAKDEDNPALTTLPKKLSWVPDLKTVVVEYNLSDYYKVALCEGQRTRKHEFRLTGINARDLGYPFVYANELENITFLNEGNISSSPAELSDYIHTGGACGLEGGCNNGSPYQPNLVFYLNRLPEKAKTSMRLKLWKKAPLNALAPADANLLMLFR